MNVDGMIFISVDDHVVEPPHLFEGRIPRSTRIDSVGRADPAG